MLSDADRQRTKDVFGADDSQVERDHLISHALAAISVDLGERVMFYGGTALARDFGRPDWQSTAFRSQDAASVSVHFPSGPRIQVQLVPADHYPAWPFELRELEQSYADAGPASLLVPCLDAFVAWKTVTFMDRRSPRDLWDLPSTSTIPAAPSEGQWRRDLAHQTQLTMTAAAARSVVVAAWAAVRR